MRVEMATGGRSLKSQMRLADKVGSPDVLILGEDELAARALTVRDMVAKRDFPRAIGISSSADTLRQELLQLTQPAAEERA
jgi:histidyl-tRNA synthetase